MGHTEEKAPEAYIKHQPLTAIRVGDKISFYNHKGQGVVLLEQGCTGEVLPKLIIG